MPYVFIHRFGGFGRWRGAFFLDIHMMASYLLEGHRGSDQQPPQPLIWLVWEICNPQHRRRHQTEYLCSWIGTGGRVYLHVFLPRCWCWHFRKRNSFEAALSSIVQPVFNIMVMCSLHHFWPRWTRNNHTCQTDFVIFIDLGGWFALHQP